MARDADPWAGSLRLPRGLGRLQLGLTVAVVVLVLTLAPVLASSRGLAAAVSACTLALAAYGIAFSFGLVGSLSIGVAVAWGSGALTTAYLSGERGWPLPAVVAAALAVSVITAVVVALPCARLKGHYFVVITFAVAECLYIAGTQIEVVHRGGVGHSTFATIEFLGLDFGSRAAMFQLAFVIVVAMGVLMAWIRRTRCGARMLAVRENEQLAASMGIRPLRWKLIAFAVSGVPLGLAGIVYAYNLHSVTVEAFHINTAITVLLVAVLGGARSPYGPPIAAVVVVFLPEVLGLEPMVQQFVYGALIAAVILFLPAGIVPTISNALQRRLAPVRTSFQGARRAEEAEPESAERRPREDL